MLPRLWLTTLFYDKIPTMSIAMTKFLGNAFFVSCFLFLVFPTVVFAASPTVSPSPTFAPTPPVETVEREPVVQSPEARLGKLEQALYSQEPGILWLNPVKHAVRSAVSSGVSLETIVLLLLLPVVASVIAAFRHIVGLRGFGILLPAALSVAFLEMGPVPGIALFLIIVFVSTFLRIFLRRVKIKFQYLPRMALILWGVVVSVLLVLFAAPLVSGLSLPQVSILPVLFLILLSEDFTRVQLGKSIRVAVNLTSETLILALVCFLILSLRAVQLFAVLNPEIVLLGSLLLNIFIGRYVGLRILEFWRFRKLIRQ